MNITNCRNCGGILDRYGHCPYCGTNYKKLNQIDIEDFELIDIEIRIKRNDNTFILPVRGHISEIEISQDTADISLFAKNTILKTYGYSSLRFEFDGVVVDS